VWDLFESASAFVSIERPAQAELGRGTLWGLSDASAGPSASQESQEGGRVAHSFAFCANEWGSMLLAQSTRIQKSLAAAMTHHTTT
jgi:hypothetical protein